LSPRIMLCLGCAVGVNVYEQTLIDAVYIANSSRTYIFSSSI